MTKKLIGLLIASMVILVHSEPLSAARLISARAAPQLDGSTLLVLHFDTPVNLEVVQAAGRELTFSVSELDMSSVKMQANGLVKSLGEENGNISVKTRLYTNATLIPAGTGVYVVWIKKAREPKDKPLAGSAREEPSQQVDLQPESGPEIGLRPPSSTPLQTPGSLSTGNVRSKDSGGGAYGVPGQFNIESETAAPQVSNLLPLAFPERVREAQRIAAEGNPDRAISVLQRFEQGTPEFGWSRIAAGDILLEQNQARRALDSYREALRDKETEELAAAKLALTFQNMGNLEGASAMWERVLRIGDGSLFIPLEVQTEQLDMAEQPEELPRQSVISFSYLKRYLYYLIGAVAIMVFIAMGIRKSRGKKHVKMEDELLEDELGISIPPLGEEEAEPEEEAGGLEQKVADMYSEQQEGAEPESMPESDVTLPPTDSESTGEVDTEPGTKPERIPEKAAPSAGPSKDEESMGSADWGLGDSKSEVDESKKERIEAMHKEGLSVREIAEALQMGQDEVEMTISMIGQEETA